uniref:Fas ligand (TNF superfamily, member 6) n=1 Tax=Astyanax mexicanus TaxID=7994 RepID=W5KC70_ASTMX
MNGNLRYQYPPVFTVDAAGGLHQQHHHHHPQMAAARTDPTLVPCWTFPPARAQTKRRSCGGLTSAAGTLLVMVLVVIFAALGLGAYQIRKLEMEVIKLKKEMNKPTESMAPQKLVGNQVEANEKANHIEAAHLMGKMQRTDTLKWEAKHGRAFTKGIQYRDGSLLVNKTGLYFVYSRVEFLSNNCKQRDSLVHEVYVKSNGENQKLMGDRREGFCQAGSTEVWTSGSNLGSIQELKQGDLVFVSVSHPERLSHEYYDNYFGIFSLS